MMTNPNESLHRLLQHVESARSSAGTDTVTIPRALLDAYDAVVAWAASAIEMNASHAPVSRTSSSLAATPAVPSVKPRHPK